jgi:hypothetical protein
MTYTSRTWVEDGVEYTTCRRCNRLLKRQHGPMCSDCRKAYRVAKMARRKARRGR